MHAYCERCGDSLDERLTCSCVPLVAPAPPLAWDGKPATRVAADLSSSRRKRKGY